MWGAAAGAVAPARSAFHAVGAFGGWVATQRPGSGRLANRPALESTTSSSAGRDGRTAILFYRIIIRVVNILVLTVCSNYITR